MTRPWWDRKCAEAVLREGVPVLTPGGRAAMLEALNARIRGFVPEWRDLSDEDAGVALVRLFGLQLDQILSRAERLSEKALVEFLSTAGISLAPPRSATAILAFTPDPDNTATVEVSEGFQLLSPRADGEKGDVIWETDIGLSVPNAPLAERHAFDGEIAFEGPETGTFLPFGQRPVINAALYLGFDAKGAARSALSLCFVAADGGTPKPVAEGGPPPTARPRSGLRWEALTGRGFLSADVSSDDTDALRRTGIVTLKLPRDWVADRPDVLGDGAALYWLRLRLASGEMPNPPRLAAIHPHAIIATAKETWRDEFPVPERDGTNSTVRLSRAPVLAGSVVLDVDEGAAAGDLFGLPDEEAGEAGQNGTFRRWQEVATLAGQGPDARVFVLDALTGTLTFGNGREGMEPPPGSRNIAVRSYCVTLGAAGNVAAGEIARMQRRPRGIEAATNPLPASGGVAGEELAAALARGPAGIKARGRAVSINDVALMARFAPGADILRAYALSATDPGFPGAVRPGTVGVFVIANRHPSDPPDAPPVASSETLGAVARHLAGTVGPIGARVSVGNPRFQEVRVEASLTVAPGRDASAAVSAVNAALNRWLSPETGDWQIGATLGHADLVHVVLSADDAIVAVPFLTLSLDGIGHPACSNVPLSRFGLPWPGLHRLAAETEEEGS